MTHYFTDLFLTLLFLTMEAYTPVTEVKAGQMLLKILTIFSRMKHRLDSLFCNFCY